MVKVMLLEDEYYTRKFLKQQILTNPLINDVIDISESKQAINVISKEKPDIVLLDIELKLEEKINGIEVAKIIYEIASDIELVFVTGYSKYAIESFEVHPYDYILKPVNKDKLKKVITELTKKIIVKKYSNNKIIIKNKNEKFFIPFEEIIFIERQNKDTFVHTKHRIYNIFYSLNKLEDMLKDNFVRVHQSYLININKIDKISEVANRSYTIKFNDYNQKALMSRYKYEKNKEKFAPTL